MRTSYLWLYYLRVLNKIFISLLNSMAAVIIQAHWRGHMGRRQIHFSAKPHPPAVESLTSQPNSRIEIPTVLKKEEIKNTVTIQEQREKSAILIQVNFNLWVKLIMRNVFFTFHWVILNNRQSPNLSNLQIHWFISYLCDVGWGWGQADCASASHPSWGSSL